MAITQKGREPANIKKRMDTLFHKLIIQLDIRIFHNIT